MGTLALAGMRILLLVFSRSSDSVRIANAIRDRTGADMYNITVDRDYSGFTGYCRGMYDVYAKTDMNITSELPDCSNYDVVFVGAPTWCWTIPAPLRKFLAGYDFKGKKVIPFTTAGSNDGKFFKHFAEQAKNAEVLEGRKFFKMRKETPSSIDEKVLEWLQTIPVNQKN